MDNSSPNFQRQKRNTKTIMIRKTPYVSERTPERRNKKSMKMRILNSSKISKEQEDSPSKYNGQSGSLESILRSSSSENSEKSQKSQKSIKSKQSKRKGRDTSYMANMAEGILDQFEKMLENADCRLPSHKEEELKQKILDHLVDKANERDQSVISQNGQENSDDLESIFQDLINKSSPEKKKEESIYDQANSVNGTIKNFDTTINSYFPKTIKLSKQVLKDPDMSSQSQSQSEQSLDSNDDKDDFLVQIKHKYQRLMDRSHDSEPYYLMLDKQSGWQKYLFRFKYYSDQHILLGIRKLVYLFINMMTLCSKIIIQSKFYQIVLTIVILSNIVLFVYTDLSSETIKIQFLQNSILVFYIVELFLQLCAFGYFESNFIIISRTTELMLIILYYLHINQIYYIIDISPLRIMRLLVQLGSIVEGLKKMMNTLIESLKFILEASAVVILFCLFFASIGNSLFIGLYNQRCNINIEESWVPCIQGTCFQNTECIITDDTPDIPTNFNNVIYSFGQILRTVTMDDWSYNLYFTIKGFHPTVFIYYVLIIFVGGFFGFNIPIAVFKTHYSEMNSFKEEIVEKPTLFSISQLKKNGFYQLLIQTSNNICQDIPIELIFKPNLESKISFQENQRLLSGKMKSARKRTQLQQIRKQLKQFRLRDLLLPKYKQINQFYKTLDLRKYISEEAQFGQLKQFCKAQIVLKKIVDYDVLYKPTSQIDVMRKSLFPLFKKRIENEYKNHKIKFYYKPIKEKNVLKRFIKTSQDQLKPRFPYYISVRLQIRLSSSSSSSSEVNEKAQREVKRTINPFAFMGLRRNQTFEITEVKPFIESTNQIMLNGQYFDYKGIKEKINKPITIEIAMFPKFIEEYNQFRRKEQQKKIARRKNWSGNNVLNTSIEIVNKFDLIFKGLNTKDIEIWMTSFSGILIILRKRAFYIINFKPTKFFFDLTILINTLFLSLQGIVSRPIIDNVEDVATILLSTEIILQLFVYKAKRIAKNKHHMIELLIVILSLIEFTLSDYLNVSEQYLRLMRATKCLLFYRCLSYIEMAKIIGAIAQITYKSYIYLTFLMFVMVLTFGMIGMELYGGKLDSYHDIGYMHSFDDPIKASMTVFNIMTNDDWYGVFRLGTVFNIYYAVIYSYTMVFVLNYFVYGIVMAILLDGFSQYLDKESSNEENSFLIDKVKQLNKLNKQLNQQNSDISESPSSSSGSSSSNEGFRQLARTVELRSKRVAFERETLTPVSLIHRNTQQVPNTPHVPHKMFQSCMHITSNVNQRYNRQQNQQQDFLKRIKSQQENLKNQTNINVNIIKGQASKVLRTVTESIMQIDKKLQRKTPKLYNQNNCHASLFLFPKSSQFRKVCYIISSHLLLKIYIDSIIILSIFITGFPELFNETILSTLLLIINISIFIEFFLKIIAYGALFDQGTYINCTWKIVDFLYLIAYFSKVCHFGSPPVFDVLITFIYFRPMKLLYRIKWVARVRAALAQSLFDIINVFLVLLLVWLMFGVFAMMLYAGKMGYCEEPFAYNINRDTCLENNQTWITHKHNFDNITTALPTLFVISTFDGWGSILWVAQNARESNLGPAPYESQVPTYLFFIAFCTIGSMFFLNLFTGVLFINFKANQKQIENQQLTQAQIEFKNVSNLIIKDHPIYATHPDTKFRNFLVYIAEEPYFKHFAFFFLIVNSFAIMMIFFRANDTYLQVLNTIHHICTVLFIFWVLIQLIGFGYNRYINNYWRRFYIFIIIIGIVDLTIDFRQSWFQEYIDSTQLTQYYQSFRILYVLRSLRIIIIFKGLQNLSRLIRVLSFVIPFLFNILFILFIVMIVFAFFGVMLFGEIDKGAILDEYINFSNLWLAMLTLFKCASGDDFRTVMNDCMQYNPYCKEDPKYCGSKYAQVYFILFMLISNYILLNLFVLGLIEQFELFFNNQDSILQTFIENIDDFKEAWFKYSQQGGKLMKFRNLPHLLLEIRKPLGCELPENIWDAAKQALSYNLITDNQNLINFNQVLFEIFFNRYKQTILFQGSEQSRDKIKHFCKEMRFRLAYYRRGQQYRRTNIGPQLKLKGKTNVLNMMMVALTCFQSWKTYTHRIFDELQVQKQFYTERSQQEHQQKQKHSISERSLESRGKRKKFLDVPIYRQTKQQIGKRVSMVGTFIDYQFGDHFDPQQQENSLINLETEGGRIQSVKTLIKKK